MARLASTSLVFMLWLTPAPAWKGSTRKASIEAGLERPRLRRGGIGDEAEDLVGGLHDGLEEVVRRDGRSGGSLAPLPS